MTMRRVCCPRPECRQPELQKSVCVSRQRAALRAAQRHLPACQHAPVQRGLVDASHLVEHKQAGKQHRQREDLGAILASLHSTQAAGRSARPFGAVQPGGRKQWCRLGIAGLPYYPVPDKWGCW